MEKALLDANVLVGAYRSDDELHKKATAWVSNLKRKGWSFVSTNLVIQETATVLSMRVSMNLAKKFLKDQRNILDEEIFVDKQLETKSWEIFLRQTKKGTSFVDCSNLAAIEMYHLDGILSFDRFYPKELLVSPSDTLHN